MNYKILLLPLFILLLPVFVMAEDLEKLCAQISSSDTSCQNMNSAACQEVLQKCANYYDQQSSEIAKDLTKTAVQKNTLQNAVSSLKKKITGLEGKIKQGTLMVKDLNLQINDTETSITKTETKIEDSQAQISAILNAVYQEDKKPSFIILLNGKLSDFFNNLVYLENLNAKVSDLLENTTDLKVYLEGQKDSLDSEKNDLEKFIEQSKT